jgi:monoamine oxidase
MYMNWGRIPFNLGSWVTRAITDPEDKAPGYYDGPYKQFIEPDGPIFFAGDHCSHIIGWQEGAALSAHRALKLICEKVGAAKA